ncbi:hypothetical protein AB0I91_29925 [Actinosynnema sp. NPDC049800]
MWTVRWHWPAATARCPSGPSVSRGRLGYPYGDNKTYDAANFGIFKQSWYMPRNKCDRCRGQTSNQWNNGAALDSNLSAHISCLHQSQNAYGSPRVVTAVPCRGLVDRAGGL